MAVAVGNIGASDSGNSASLTWSHSTPAGSDIVLIVLLSMPEAVTVSSVDWNSRGLTQLRRDTNPGFEAIELWYLVAADASTTSNVSVTFSAKAQNKGQSIDFTGGDTPSDAAGSTGDAVTSASNTVLNTTADDMVVDGLIVDANDALAGADQTEQFLVTQGGKTLKCSTQDGANGGVMSWTFTSGDFAHIALRVPAAAAGIALTPSALALPLSIPTPTITRAQTISPTALTLPVVMPTPTIGISQMVTPDPVGVPVAVPAPSLALTLGLTPDAVALPVSVPAPSLALALALSPDPLALPVGIPAPSIDVVGGPTTLTPTPVALPLALPAAALSLTLALAPDALAMPVSVPVPSVTVQGPVTLSPDALALPVGIPAPSVMVAVQVAPDALALAVVVVTPSVTVAATAVITRITRQARYDARIDVAASMT